MKTIWAIILWTLGLFAFAAVIGYVGYLAEDTDGNNGFVFAALVASLTLGVFLLHRYITGDTNQPQVSEPRPHWLTALLLCGVVALLVWAVIESVRYDDIRGASTWVVVAVLTVITMYPPKRLQRFFSRRS